MTEQVQPRIVTLKEQATKLGINYSPNIGADTLDARIKSHLAQMDTYAAPTEQDQVDAKIKEATKLVRIIATPVDQSKTEGERQGEYVMGGNSVVGTYKKFVPYGQITHLEQVLLNVLEEKKYQQRYGKGNQQYREVKEFNIQILPDLTPDEVAELRKMQALRKEADKL